MPYVLLELFMSSDFVGEFGIVYKGIMKKGGVHHMIAVKALKGK